CSCAPCATQDQAESVLGRDLQPDGHPARGRRAVSVTGNPAQARVGRARDERQHRDGYGECPSATAAPGSQKRDDPLSSCSVYALTSICSVAYAKSMESAFAILAEPNRRARSEERCVGEEYRYDA